MTSTLFSKELCGFIWQYEQRKRWNLFSCDEIELINDALKKNQQSVDITSKKQRGKMAINFSKMCQINIATFYEKRIRCLVGDEDGLSVWSWKNSDKDWVSFSPALAFLLEIAFRKKEMEISLSNYEINLEKYEIINKETDTCHSIKRDDIDLAFEKGIQDIVEKNKSLFEKALSEEIASLKRSIDAINCNSNGTQTKKRRKESTVIDQNEDMIEPNPEISKIKPNLGAVKDSKNGNSVDSVPVDAECPIKADFLVYFDDKALSFTLNQTNLQNNNNKFYIVQLLRQKSKEQYCVWRRWGRVGQRGQTSLNKYGTSLTEAKKEFEGKFYDKTRNRWDEIDNFVHVKGKYDLLHINLSPQEREAELNVESKLIEELKDLMEMICDTRRMEEIMKEMYYDSKKTPLGQLTSLQVKSGYIALNKIAMILKQGGSNNELVNACNDFYTKIPHNYGMKRPPLIKTQNELEEKQKMLEALANIRVAMNVMNAETDVIDHPLDKYYKSLNCSLDCLENDSAEYKEIEKCLKETHGPTHNNYEVEIVSIFKCFKPQEEKSFINNTNKLILWHGSRIVNWLGILKEGLRIAPPEAPTTGYMFGKGIYFADVSSKSANYCYATKKKNEGLLLMCEVSLGKQNTLFEADETLPINMDKDFNSVFGKGRVSPTDFELNVLSPEAKVPVGPLVVNTEHKGSLHYNEYIVYNTQRVKMKYLIRLKFNFK